MNAPLILPLSEEMHAREPVRLRDVVDAAKRWARAMAEKDAPASESQVMAAVESLAAAGLLAAPIFPLLTPAGERARLGLDRETHRALHAVLGEVGRASLPLGRLYEGHVNALILIQRYGTPQQIAQAAADAAAGMLFGVWNTGPERPMSLAPVQGPSSPSERAGPQLQLAGRKTFASGASFVQRPLVTAALPDGGWQMCVLPTEELSVEVDRGSWEPLGMEASFSFSVSIEGVLDEARSLVGAPGDFYREPLFSGGAVRFCAVQMGGAQRLLEEFAAWLGRSGRTEDPYATMRLSELVLAVHSGLAMLAMATAALEELAGHEAAGGGEEGSIAAVLQTAALTRVAVERACTEAIRVVTAGVGARGLLEPQPFGRIVRDLMMYLRQPAPDKVMASLARSYLERGSPGVFGPDETRR